MAHARISMYMPPDIDPTKAAIAYGCRALPKLNEELQSEVLLTRQKALVALCDLMHDPEHVYEAIHIGCLESLKVLLKDEDNLVRIKTTEVLHIMATHNIGRTGLLEKGVILALALLLSDHQKVCRENLHQAYKHVAQTPEGARGITSSGLIPWLVNKLNAEEEHIQEIILDTLAPCLQEDATQALESQAVPYFKKKLLNDNPRIRSKAARALIAISIPLEGKNQVWQNGVIPILVDLLSDVDEEVQANAAGALMHATVTTEGKYAALDASAINPLLELLCSSPIKVCLNAAKALTMLAEAPEGRKLLSSHVSTFRVLLMHENEAIRRAAQVAIKVIEWKP
ncbi:radial spoke head 14 homolog [Cricetulus griseus]|uniref:Radial spoke head 14 homolog n=1 Tax=Cricetulus griseus TaxID=10029 RepID=G3HMY6_CRIGR|nr:radial spoke head 14 homolog [Cricetulus griseus]XP_035313363.1 radial spoke head 14 homolog [Cricetulus griseus]EGW02533.1 hypothetical protein I79_012117 [Cricetulus griseus]